MSGGGERYLYWGGLAFNELSEFGNFPEPEPKEPVAPPASGTWKGPRSDLGGLRALLAQRRSTRSFAGSLESGVLSDILWATYGLVDGEPVRRTVPSAGALYSLRLVVVTEDVVGASRGCYEWRAPDGQMQRIAKAPGRLADWFSTRSIDYQTVAAVVFIVGDLSKVAESYGERGYRYLLLESGHAAQNLCLAASALGVPHIPLGGFEDSTVVGALGLAEGSLITYSIALGGALPQAC